MSYMALALLVLTTVSITTRALPFLLGKWIRRAAFFERLGRYTPAVLLPLLALAALPHESLGTFPYGLPEFGALVLVVLTQLWRRKLLLSVGVGTTFYVLLINFTGAYYV